MPKPHTQTYTCSRVFSAPAHCKHPIHYNDTYIYIYIYIYAYTTHPNIHLQPRFPPAGTLQAFPSLQQYIYIYMPKPYTQTYTCSSVFSPPAHCKHSFHYNCGDTLYGRSCGEVSTCMYVCMYVCIFIYTHTSCTCMVYLVFVCVYVCTYMYVYVCIPQLCTW